jgi:hypothetical protein
MGRSFSGERLRLGGMQPSQQLVQSTEDLARQVGRDSGLRLSDAAEQSRKASVLRIDEERKLAEDQLEAAEHRPTAYGCQRAQRKSQPARRRFLPSGHRPEHSRVTKRLHRSPRSLRFPAT